MTAMRIWLVDPPFPYPSKNNAAGPNIGMLSIAAALRSNMNSVELTYLPLQFWDTLGISFDIENEFNINPPDIVGISCITSSMPSAKRIARRIKSFSRDVVTVFGGVAATLQAAQLIYNDDIDYVVHGPGEAAFITLLNSNPTPKGTRFGHHDVVENRIIAGSEDPALLTMPAYDLGHLDDFSRFKIPVPVELSRGCPYNCTFCYLQDFPRRYGAIGLDIVESSLDSLRQKYGVESVFVTDDTFGMQRHRTQSQLSLMKNSALEYCIETRLEVLAQLNPEALYGSGIREVIVGIESTDPQILAGMNKVKGIKSRWMSLAERTLRSTADAGIVVHPIFMIGWPGETDRSLAQSLRFVENVCSHALIVPFVSFPTPHPGSTLERISNSIGLRVVSTRLENYNHLFPVAVAGSLGPPARALRKVLDAHNTIRVDFGDPKRNPPIDFDEWRDQWDLLPEDSE